MVEHWPSTQIPLVRNCRGATVYCTTAVSGWKNGQATFLPMSYMLQEAHSLSHSRKQA